MNHRDINSRILSHLLTEKRKLVLEVFINLKVNTSQKHRRHRYHHNRAVEPQSNQYSLPWLESHVEAKDGILYVRARRDSSNILNRMLVATSNAFMSIRTVLRNVCYVLARIVVCVIFCGLPLIFSFKKNILGTSFSTSEYEEGMDFDLETGDTPGVGGEFLELSVSSSEDSLQKRGFKLDYSEIDGPNPLDHAAWTYFRIDITKKLVKKLKSSTYVRVRDELYCMSAEVLRSTRHNGCPLNTLIKITKYEDSLDTVNTLIAVVCNEMLPSSTGTTRVRCYTADPNSDVIAVEYVVLKPNEDGNLECACQGSKLAEVARGKDFTVWEPRDTVDFCSQCKYKSIKEGYGEFRNHIDELLSTASPCLHETDLSDTDFLLEKLDDNDEENSSGETDDIRSRQAVLSQISGISEVMVLSVKWTIVSILVILLILFLPITIIGITPARNQAEIIAAGLGYIPAMLAALIAIATVAPASVSAKVAKKLVYKKVKTFKDLQSILNLQDYSDQQWREALINMNQGEFKTYPYGSVYPFNSEDGKSQDSNYFSLGDWCQMSLRELQSYRTPIQVISNKNKRVLLMDSTSSLSLKPIIPRRDFLCVESETRLSKTKLEDLAHCDEHQTLVFKEDI